MNSRFVDAANRMKKACGVSVYGFTFQPNKRFGVVENERGAKLLNLGAAGALYALIANDGCNEKEVVVVLHDSYDRQEFWRWMRGFTHSFNGTKANNPEARALQALDEQANADVYRLLGVMLRRD